MSDLSVLLVEDEESYAAIVNAELVASPVRVRHATSLHSARGALAANHFDAILLDLNLPDSAGVETVERVRRLAPDVPIVVLTGNDDETTSIAAVQSGADDYLLKHESDGTVLVRALRYATERAALRHSIQENEARFRALVEQGYDAITLVDATGEIVFETQSTARVTGYLPGERVGHPVEDYLHPDDVPMIRDKLRECLLHPDEILHGEFRFRHKDGSWRWGEGRGVNRLGNPSVRAIVINHHDVTERKAMEQALRRSELQLRQAQRMEAIGRLAGGVAHDFNNVLTAIFGYADLLLAQFSDDDPRREDVLEIRRSADRAASLTRQLLAFSRKQVMQPRTIDLNAIIASIQRLIARLVGEDVGVEVRFASDLDLVRADPGQIEQVLMNLAANARDAMPIGGTLRIETRNEQISGEQPDRPGLRHGRYVVLQVTDNGCGISEELREHMFEPFFTTKEQGKGTGLGLAMVYGVVKQSGGFIYVDSAPGEGATFLVYLPAQDTLTTEMTNDE